MWGLLWILPAVLLVWAIVLVVKKVRRAAREPESKEEEAKERIRRAMEE